METNTIIDLIIKAAYQVHDELGTGFTEKTYENALMIALRDLGLGARQQFPVKVYFREQVVGDFFADIIVSDTISPNFALSAISVVNFPSPNPICYYRFSNSL